MLLFWWLNELVCIKQTWHIKCCKGLAVIVGTFMASKEELENEKTGELRISPQPKWRDGMYVFYTYSLSPLIQSLKNIQN